MRMHKTTYAPMIYTALCIMFWMRAYPLLEKVGGGWAWNSLAFWAPNGSNSRAQPPPTSPRNGFARIPKTLCTGLYKS
jgi:hypothetical protein